MEPDSEKLVEFAAALDRAYESMDWVTLGDSYCESGGESFFSEEAVDAIRDAGLHIASDLAGRLPSKGPQHSLYVGLGVAELVPILFETILLGRKVTAVTLPGPEPEQLNRALAEAQEETSGRIPTIEIHPLKHRDEPECSHLWLASVVTDPDAFPALHDQLYKRTGTREATGRGNIHKERKAANLLFAQALTWLEPPACITTSQEELSILETAMGSLAIQLTTPVSARLSPIVGDPIVHCLWSNN